MKKPKTVLTTRRRFLASTAVGIVPTFSGAVPPSVFARKATGPVAVSSGNGREPVKLAVELMSKGDSPVDAAVRGVNLVEDDPNDMSVGLGGLPNADGVVELDSCVMDGPTHLAGAVASLQNIKNPSRVALVVMRRTDHVLLVGRGALAFAKAHGFKEENLLTEKARMRWLRWKERLSDKDDWIERGGNALGGSKEDGKGREDDEKREHGTIHVSALDAKARLGACTTTSGLSWKIPGRVGDSPLIGCGLYTDNDIGSAGSTGRGEAAILSNGSHLVVEHMRRGLAPQAACLEVLRRVVHYTRIRRLRDDRGRPDFQLKFYALNKKGEYGSASMYPSSFVVCTDEGDRRLDAAALYPSR